MNRFESKVVIVTSAASGIGASTARRFASEGGSVVLVDRNEMALADIARELPSDRVLAHVADVSDSDAVDAMVATTVKRFGRLDVLVNNAGVHEGGEPQSITNEQWRQVMATDVDGVFFGCRAALPHLAKTKGSIVNTTSVSGTGGDWSMSPYNAAKGAVVNLTRALAMDLGKKGVRVNAVCPTLTRTGMTADVMNDGKLLAKLAEQIPLGRVCEPDEIASVIAFVASEDASFITGSDVAIDGGVSASNGQPPQ
ncbi:SDR family NAD(P)-dependent oxidoreductase [Bradyrhizobium sp. CCGUVB14]|uniref:SDR family NAD(P)-dependent oxidoreductase n=1 Tax=Bradyrhizobium sp. CCGUVB14 TaxID=2949628 RepID=UPI0020B2C236|nr:SDR family oxidoreductase [Bradyrhizobium sp. CCGUVB14]MCP3442337.1 SDR family oxidoreductase [Bradyrhizobium sp. CCGUVB14]